MLTELRVRDLGVIADLALVLGPGMTALTGETGAGKTLVVEAIELLVGGRADPTLVRDGSTEAVVEGRFVLDTEEVVLRRAVPSTGRSRAYVDGTMAPVSALAETGARLVDMHGQHAHQSLLSAAVQREALDAFARVDLEPLRAARQELREIDSELAALGGDARVRAREIELLRFQVHEIEQAAIADGDEDERLAAEEEVRADVASHRDAGAAALAALDPDGGAGDAVGAAVAAVAGRTPFAAAERRLRTLASEMADIAREIRTVTESLDDDPERLEAIRQRRQLLHELKRKYGATLHDVAEFHSAAIERIVDLEGHEARAEVLETRRAQTLDAIRAAEARIGSRRRKMAGQLASAIEDRLRELAMPKADVSVEVGDADPGDDVRFMLAANPGEPARPFSRVASGGELARTMLATRLVLTAGPPTLVFDEVDAGIGGEAALAVGRALATVAADHQILVVTHLPQVAAFANAQIAVTKHEIGGRTVASATVLDSEARVAELSRMLSGSASSAAARVHAQELLASAQSSGGAR